MSSRSEAAPPAEPAPSVAGPLRYVVLIVVVTLAAFVYDLRNNGIFACSSAANEPGRYLAYCNSGVYNDYDHGAFWFGLEPDAIRAVQSADALFVGSSRMQFAFSSPATQDWFASHNAHFYLLGFSYSENVLFTGPFRNPLTAIATARAMLDAISLSVRLVAN